MDVTLTEGSILTVLDVLFSVCFNSFLLGELEETTGTPRTAWMKTTQQDLKSMNLSLNEAIDMAQNRPLWRLMSMFGTTHS